MAEEPVSPWPYIHLVPKELHANLEFRKLIIDRCAKDREAQRAMWMMCARDPLFFYNVFCFGHEPKAGKLGSMPITTFPLITWPYQDKVLTTIAQNLGRYDMHIVKCRDMGATWMVMMIFMWRFIFHPHESFLVTSRKEELVDCKGSTGTIFYKLDYMLKYLPKWMKPHIHRADQVMLNKDNETAIVGEATTVDMGASQRHTAACLDEFARVPDGDKVVASTFSVAGSRIFVSTPQGAGTNAFYQMSQKCRVTIQLPWNDHPLKRQGIYLTVTGKPWSLWRQAAHEELLNEALEAQEIEMDYAGSSFPFFSGELMQPYIRDYAIPPKVIGDLAIDNATANPKGFMSSTEGKLLLWIDLDKDNNPSSEIELVLGGDVSPPTGATPSVLSGMDKRTGVKVLEFATARISHDALANMAVAICRWFKGPTGSGGTFIWEENGPGVNVTRRIREIGYARIYYRESEDTTGKRIYKNPGWWTDETTKQELLDEYRLGLTRRKIINHSLSALNETECYVYQVTTGKVVNTRSMESYGSDVGANHGDRVIADALAWWLARHQIEPVKAVEKQVESCLEARMMRAKREEALAGFW